MTALAVPDLEPVPDSRVVELGAGAGAGAPVLGATSPSRRPAVLRGDADALAAALAGSVDAVLVTARDAATHRTLAEPLLRAGLPVLVDKPFTATVDDAEHLVRLADRLGVPLTSSSALRTHPVVQDVAHRWRSTDGGIAVATAGAADPDGPYGGLAFTAVHPVEVALAVLRDRPVHVVGTAVEAGARTLTVRAGRDVATIRLTRPSTDAATPFHLTVTGSTGRTDDPLELGPDYLRPQLRAFVDGLLPGSGTSIGPTGSELVTTVVLLAALAP
ncbi:MAG TPA: Gfo/Idh/MocA family oxidoreductase [Cellulomonas sp.]